jgi:uncharacterized protein
VFQRRAVVFPVWKAARITAASSGFTSGRGLRRLSGPRPLLLHATIVTAFFTMLSWVGAADLQSLEIVSQSGVHVFSVELATTDEERERGLMFRKDLPDGHGMLFDFETDRNVAMWMKNTLIPLDMIFIRSDGRIANIAESTEPMSTRIIPSQGSVRAVLEVAGGTTKRLGIKVGDRVAHPMFHGS